jgi:hypothetical protein
MNLRISLQFFAALTAALIFYLPAKGFASLTSYYSPHPIGWMHLLPVGETPGWSGKYWLNFELSQASIWNSNATFTDRRNSRVLTYKADYEQTSLVTNFGFAIGERWAFDVVIPFADRNRGFLDQFIDNFHTWIGSDRFAREQNEKFDSKFIAKTGGTNEMEPTNTAVGNVKFKLKYWMWQWTGPYEQSCDCGFAISAQLKVPTIKARTGWSSGSMDSSVLLLLGAPIGDFSGIWVSAGYTHLGENEVFKDWPINRISQMYELTMDLALSDHWGVILQGRMESPFLRQKDLTFNYTTSRPDLRAEERVASGWNSLVHWRGTESLGLRWRSLHGQQWTLSILEDWGIGNQDDRGDTLYVNNAPDVAFMLQGHFHF